MLQVPNDKGTECLRFSVFGLKGLSWASGLYLSGVGLFMARHVPDVEEEGTGH